MRHFSNTTVKSFFLNLLDVLKFPGVFLWPVASGRRKSREFLSRYAAHPERSARQTPGISFFPCYSFQTSFPLVREPVERTFFVSVFSSFFPFAGFLCVLTHPHTESTYSIGRRKLRGFNIHNICTKNLHTCG